MKIFIAIALIAGKLPFTILTASMRKRRKISIHAKDKRGLIDDIKTDFIISFSMLRQPTMPKLTLQMERRRIFRHSQWTQSRKILPMFKLDRLLFWLSSQHSFRQPFESLRSTKENHDYHNNNNNHHATTTNVYVKFFAIFIYFKTNALLFSKIFFKQH